MLPVPNHPSALQAAPPEAGTSKASGSSWAALQVRHDAVRVLNSVHEQALAGSAGLSAGGVRRVLAAARGAALGILCCPLPAERAHKHLVEATRQGIAGRFSLDPLPLSVCCLGLPTNRRQTVAPPPPSLPTRRPAVQGAR